MTVVLLVVLYALSSVFTYFVSCHVVLKPVDAKLSRVANQFIRTGTLPTMGGGHPDAIYWMLSQSDVSTSTNAPQVVTNAKVVKDILTSHQSSIRRYSIQVGGQAYGVLYIPDSVVGMPSVQSLVLLTNETAQLFDLKKLESVITIVGLFGVVLAMGIGFFLSDRMLRPIRKSWNRQLEFVADASHELRTPLAVVQSNLGIVMEHTDESRR